jgi:hypothetical protein
MTVSYTAYCTTRFFPIRFNKNADSIIYYRHFLCLHSAPLLLVFLSKLTQVRCFDNQLLANGNLGAGEFIPAFKVIHRYIIFVGNH